MFENTENIALWSLQTVYIFVLRAEKVTIFAPFLGQMQIVHYMLESSSMRCKNLFGARRQRSMTGQIFNVTDKIRVTAGQIL